MVVSTISLSQVCVFSSLPIIQTGKRKQKKRFVSYLRSLRSHLLYIQCKFTNFNLLSCFLHSCFLRLFKYMSSPADSGVSVREILELIIHQHLLSPVRGSFTPHISTTQSQELVVSPLFSARHYAVGTFPAADLQLEGDVLTCASDAACLYVCFDTNCELFTLVFRSFCLSAQSELQYCQVD